MKNYLCIDVGGTSMKCAIIDDEANIIQTRSIKTPPTLEEMYGDIKECFDSYKEYHPLGLALSMPGAVDSDTGVIGGASAIDYIHGPNIKQDLEALLNVNVELENDANCAALAEVWKGAASDVDDCLFIVSGTGIGGAVVKDKRIHKGKHLHGGEFGYMISDFNFDTKYINTWSWQASTVAVLKNAAKELGVDYKTLDGKEVFDHYKDNPAYFKAVDHYYWAMAKGIYNLQYAYDPEKIVIGGAVSVREDLVDEINERLDKIFEVIDIAHIRPVVLTCHYQGDANMIGALYHYLTKNS